MQPAAEEAVSVADEVKQVLSKNIEDAQNVFKKWTEEQKTPILPTYMPTGNIRRNSPRLTRKFQGKKWSNISRIIFVIALVVTTLAAVAHVVSLFEAGPNTGIFRNLFTRNNKSEKFKFEGIVRATTEKKLSYPGSGTVTVYAGTPKKSTPDDTHTLEFSGKKLDIRVDKTKHREKKVTDIWTFRPGDLQFSELRDESGSYTEILGLHPHKNVSTETLKLTTRSAGDLRSHLEKLQEEAMNSSGYLKGQGRPSTSPGKEKSKVFPVSEKKLEEIAAAKKLADQEARKQQKQENLHELREGLKDLSQAIATREENEKKNLKKLDEEIQKEFKSDYRSGKYIVTATQEASDIQITIEFEPKVIPGLPGPPQAIGEEPKKKQEEPMVFLLKNFTTNTSAFRKYCKDGNKELFSFLTQGEQSQSTQHWKKIYEYLDKMKREYRCGKPGEPEEE